MGISCCSFTANDELMDEIRKDAKIVQYEHKDNNNDDLLQGILKQRTKEKILFEVKDNPLEEYSKLVFQFLNLLRSKPQTFINKAYQYGIEHSFNNVIINHNSPPQMAWSTKKSRMISDYFQNTKNTFKSTQSKINDIKSKYKNDFVIETYISEGKSVNEEICIWNLLSQLTEQQREHLLLEAYAYCTIYSEVLPPTTTNDVNVNVDVDDINITSYFFLFTPLE